MLDIFLPPFVKNIYLYSQPINIRLGVDRLRELCEKEHGNLERGNLFLFYNKKRDRLKMFDPSEDQTMEKMLMKGSFLVPLASKNEKFVRFSPSKLQAFFRF